MHDEQTQMFSVLIETFSLKKNNKKKKRFYLNLINLSIYTSR